MSLTERETLDAIADSLMFPHASSAARARQAAERLVDDYPTVAQAFSELATWLDETDRFKAEENYTILFDLEPACTLDIGHHIYGEAYQRGSLLAGLTAECREHGVSLADELPDFLPTVLRLVGRLPDSEERRVFIDRILSIAVGKMNKALRRWSGPWAQAVSSLADVYVAPPEELDDSLAKRIRLEVLAGA